MTSVLTMKRNLWGASPFSYRARGSGRYPMGRGRALYYITSKYDTIEAGETSSHPRPNPVRRADHRTRNTIARWGGSYSSAAEVAIEKSTDNPPFGAWISRWINRPNAEYPTPSAPRKATKKTVVTTKRRYGSSYRPKTVCTTKDGSTHLGRPQNSSGNRPKGNVNSIHHAWLFLLLTRHEHSIAALSELFAPVVTKAS